MPLDPQAQKLLEMARASGLPPLNQVSVDDARGRMAKALTYTGEPEVRASVEDISMPGSEGNITLRHYRPLKNKTLPAVVFFHGGGWVLNSLNTHDHLCRALANQSGCAVLSVDYRLAPEHPYPAAIDDAWTATCWVCKHADELGIDKNRIGVAGDSSGGTQAAVVALLARDNNGPSIACQALIYPVVDHWSAGTPSYNEAGSGYSLSKDLMIWFWNHYAPRGVEINDFRVCPLRASDFSALPPTLIVTAEFDPLRDEAEQYAQRLKAAGVSVQATRYEGMMHGFVIQFRLLDKGRRGLEEIAMFLRKQLNAN